MTVHKEVEAEIRRLHFAEHWKKGSIVSQLGVHRSVVDRCVGPKGPEPKAELRQCLIGPYLPFVDETLAKYPTLTGTRLYDMLVARGFTGSLRTVTRVLRKRRPARTGEVYTRLSTLPGEESQIDWAHVGKIRVQGGSRPLYCFVIFLRHSRAMWAELVLEQTTESLVRSLVRAGEYFGGVTHRWLFDNPKSIVADRLAGGGGVRFAPGLVDLACAFNVSLRACRVRTPTDKGGVERSIRFLKTRFFPARQIQSIREGNAELLAFLRDTASRRAHPDNREMTVQHAFELEKERLMPLPLALPSTDRISSVVPGKTAAITFDTNTYSVPRGFAFKPLTLVTNDTTVRMLDESQTVIATHARSWGKHQRIEDQTHRKSLLKHRPGARPGHGQARLVSEVPLMEKLLLHWLDDGRNMGSMVARSVALLDLYGAPLLSLAATDMLARGRHDIGALGMLCEQKRTKPRVLLPVELAPHVVDCDVHPHDLGGYDVTE